MKRTHHSVTTGQRKGRWRLINLIQRLALVAVLVLAPVPMWAQYAGEQVLHSFHGAATLDGASVYSGLFLASDGRLYGTTWGGGNQAGGTVFGLNIDGSAYAILHHFTNAVDGGAPYSGVIQGFDGALYGTTYFGGISNAGTVFKIRTDGSGYEILRSFTTSPDAAYPWAGLVQGRDGWLYGTTQKGGENNLGTVFKINTNGGGYVVLHSFVSNFQDGFTPYAGLVQAYDGALYGTTDQGGSNLGGTIFRLNTDGSSHTILHHFQSGTGYWPRASLIQGDDGQLYGTTYSGGPNNGGGVVFRMGTNGLDYTVLHTFPGGAEPWANLVLISDGALYGTTEWQGDYNGGTVFRLRTDGGEYAVLHHFASAAGGDGSHPLAGLVGGAGALYGTTMSGGLWGLGTVYRLTLAPVLDISLSPQGPRITVNGFSGQRCRLDVTSNFADWTPRANLVLTNGVAELIETNAPRVSAHYRAVVQ